MPGIGSGTSIRALNGWSERGRWMLLEETRRKEAFMLF